jgi:hypothetical protein
MLVVICAKRRVFDVMLSVIMTNVIMLSVAVPSVPI